MPPKNSFIEPSSDRSHALPNALLYPESMRQHLKSFFSSSYFWALTSFCHLVTNGTCASKRGKLSLKWQILHIIFLYFYTDTIHDLGTNNANFRDHSTVQGTYPKAERCTTKSDAKTRQNALRSPFLRCEIRGWFTSETSARCISDRINGFVRDFRSFAELRSAPKGGRKKPLIPRCYRSDYRGGKIVPAPTFSQKSLSLIRKGQKGVRFSFEFPLLPPLCSEIDPEAPQPVLLVDLMAV